MRSGTPRFPQYKLLVELELLNVAMTYCGYPGEQWASKAYKVSKEMQSGKVIDEEISCTLDE
jgi:hypothetical protein